MGSLSDFVVPDSDVESNSHSAKKADAYLEIIDFIVLALSDLRLMLQEDCGKTPSMSGNVEDGSQASS